MKVTRTALPGVLVIEPEVYSDARGFFLESYHARRYHQQGLPLEFVQDNHSLSRHGTLRGLHAPGAAGPGQAGAGDRGGGVRRGGGHPAGVAHLRSLGRRLPLGRQPQAALHSRRLCPRLRHHQPFGPGGVQVQPVLRRGRPDRHTLGRSGDRDRMAHPAGPSCPPRTGTPPVCANCGTDCHDSGEVGIPPPGARASRPHKTPRERGRPARTKTTRERGRLARTKPGTREENPVKASLVHFAREWPWLGGCLQE